MTRRVAIVGAGWMGGCHAAAVQANGDRVAAVVDTDLDRARAMAADHDAIALDSIEALGDLAEGVDAAAVTTPTGDHVGTTRRLLDEGIAVLVEKPHRAPDQPAMSTRVDDPPCWVGMTTRYHRGMQVLHEAVRAGELGELCWWSDRIWYRLEPGRLPDWYFDRAVSGGGVLVTNGIHALDRARWVLGPLELRSCSMRSVVPGHEVEDAVTIAGRAADAVFETSLLWATGPVAPSGTVVVGTRGSVVIETAKHWTFTTDTGERSGEEGDELEPFREQWKAFSAALDGRELVVDPPTVASLEPVIEAIARLYQPLPEDPERGYGTIT